MRAVILLALVGAALAVPSPRSQQRIVGGSATTVDSHPFISNLQYGLWDLLWYNACSGTLLTSTSVLSAAHCFYGDSASQWRVRLGTSFASSGGTVHTVSSLVLHASYDDTTLLNDIAIVRLATAATFSSTIGVARIAGSDYVLADGTSVVALGWGLFSAGGNTPEQLHQVTIQTINQAYCVAQYASLKNTTGLEDFPSVTDSNICAGIQGVGGMDACDGDSGGPLIHSSDVVIGITSFGYGCALADYPGVRTRVASFTDWIVANA